jgi:hypothetical protein
MRNKGTLIVEDSKYPASRGKYLEKYEPFDDQKLQTLLYLNSNYSESGSLERDDSFDISCEKKAWIINIKDKVTLESIKVFQGFQTIEAEPFLNAKVNRFVLIALGKIEPEHHENVRKCQSCRFKDCQYVLT